jgi:hypothetical protein
VAAAHRIAAHTTPKMTPHLIREVLKSNLGRMAGEVERFMDLVDSGDAEALEASALEIHRTAEVLVHQSHVLKTGAELVGGRG